MRLPKNSMKQEMIFGLKRQSRIKSGLGASIRKVCQNTSNIISLLSGKEGGKKQWYLVETSLKGKTGRGIIILKKVLILVQKRRNGMEVTVAKQVDVRANLKKYFDMACSGSAIMIPRKENQNVVILSEKEYQILEKARRNAEYLAKLRRADEQIREGRVVVKSLEELEAMEDE